MEQNETTNSLFKKMDDLYNVVCNSLSINRQAKNSSIEAIEAKNLVLSDVKGNELDFYEFKEGEQPLIGAKVTVNGNITTSTHILSDGKMYEVVNGVLNEVKEVVQEFDAMKQAVENMRKQLEEKAENTKKLEEVLNVSKREIENLKQEFSAALIERKSINQVDVVDTEFKFKRLF